MARRAAHAGPIPVEAELQREPIRYERSPGFDEEREMRNEALDPQLVWHGKDRQDQDDLIVEAPPLYIQEKIDSRALVENLRKTPAENGAEPGTTLFDPCDGELDELRQIEYYRHDAAWSNRMILGDSLQAMGSLAERERLRGRVQMVYIDPPYGIRFNSNWQVSARRRDVRDGRDAAREVEQIKAFRDTWEDGIHTYLSYLRDRLVIARDLLTESGSVFVQIGDENVHRVRVLMDEVFGAENSAGMIFFLKTTGKGSDTIDSSGDYLLWYARDARSVAVNQLYAPRKAATIDAAYSKAELDDGTIVSLTAAQRAGAASAPGRRFMASSIYSDSGGPTTSGEYSFEGETFRPLPGYFWRTSNPDGLDALARANRLVKVGRYLRFKMFEDDWPVTRITNYWDDVRTGGFGDSKTYVVQTGSKVIERCMLMTTNPGDLVLDPTCGSGTTACVAEQWGRRWITIDTSRVALALARQRLMGGRYPYYLLADSPEGRAKEAQVSRRPMPPTETGGDIRLGFVYERVQHITLKSIANNPDIREGMRQEEIDAAIRRHADFELLHDRPYEDGTRVRVTGPFTVETLSPHRSIDRRDADATRSGRAAETETTGADYAQMILENLRAAGVQNGRRSERIEFSTLEEHAGTHVQAIGERRARDDDMPSRVAVALGPQYGTVSAGFVRDAAKEALQDPDIALLCVLGFSFDPNVSSVTEADGIALEHSDAGFASVGGERGLGRLKVLFVRMNAELLMGDALKKTGAGNLFTVFGEPDVEIRTVGDRIEVELRGVDVFDATSGTVRAAGTSQIALWMIDTDYDEESFFVRHCYFTGGGDPMRRLKVALKADIEAAAWSRLYRTTSIPFDRPTTGKIAIKVIDDFGDEVMKVYDLDGLA